MPEPTMHPDGRGRAVASSRTGAQLYQGYRVRHAAKPGEAKPLVGIIKSISPGEVVEVDWPGIGVTLHRGYQLIRMGSAEENERHPETRAGYPQPEPLVHAARPEEEQCWVELTRGQVEDLLSMVQDRLSAVHGAIAALGPHDADHLPTSADDLRRRRSELVVLKGSLMLGRDDPGRVTA